MEHTRYVARKRARFMSDGKPVNIRYGTPLEVLGDHICLAGIPLCRPGSQNAMDYFSQDDDGEGLKRGALVGAILSRLARRDADHQARWDKIWEDPVSQPLRRADHDDFWVWSQDFFEAPIPDLQHIAALVGARV